MCLANVCGDVDERPLEAADAEKKCRQEVPILLTALLALRRVAIHHHQLLTDSLGDVVQLLLECMHGSDASASQAALLALVDLLVSFGSAMLRHCEPQTDGSGGSNGAG